MFSKLFKKDELKLLWPFYLSFLIFGLSLVIMPFFIIYFQDLGFNYFQISIVVAAVSLGILLFEIPTGAFADSLSRKYSTILGLVIRGVSAILLLFFKDFYSVVILSFLAGIGISFISGAMDSWAISNLRTLKRTDLYHEMFIKSQVVTAFGAIVAPLIGAIMVKNLPLTYLWVFFGVGVLMTAVILFFVPELSIPNKNFKGMFKRSFQNIITGFKFIKSKRTILLVLTGILILQLMGLSDLGWQPMMTELGLPDYALGYVFSAMAAVLMIAPMCSRFLIKKKIQTIGAIVSVLRITILLLLFFVYPPMFMVGVMFFIFERGIFGFVDPAFSTYIHKKIPEKVRATIISIKSMAVESLYFIIAIIAGYFMDIYGPKNIIAISGLLGILAFIVFSKIKD
jgi:MFS family permease